MIIVCVRRWTRRGKFVFVRDGALVEIRKLLGWAGILKSSFRFVFLIENRERENRYKGILFSVFSLDARSCKDEIYRMGIGGGYCEGNLNFATASEDDEVYTKKKVSRVSFRNDFDFQFPLGNRRRKWTRGEGARKKGKIRGYRRYLGQQRRRKVFRVVESNRLDSMMMQRLLYRRWQSRFSKTRIATHRPTGRNSIRYPRFTTTNLKKKRVQRFLEFSINRTRNASPVPLGIRGKRNVARLRTSRNAPVKSRWRIIRIADIATYGWHMSRIYERPSYVSSSTRQFPSIK